MKEIQIGFTDGGIFCKSLLLKILSDEFKCISTDNNLDILIYGLCGNLNKKFNCKKLQIICENSFPNFNECDYAIGPHYIKFDRYCRIPFFAFNREYELLCNNAKVKVDNPLDRKFCSAIISNNINADPRREELIMKLNNRKKIDSVGKAFNTTGKCLPPRKLFAEDTLDMFTNPAKIAFMTLYKFNLALENSQVEGYCTEKITDAFAANTVPIYFGDTKVKDEFNKDSFIDISDFNTIDDAIDYILEVDSNDELYMKMLNASNVKCKSYIQQFKDFVIKAIDGPIFEHNYGNLACL